jgi:NADPH-dependent 2,4-dienoyl-CoA reductase/sulfur reductase-like enzyme
VTDPVLIVGASTAGLSAARELRKLGYDGAIQLIDGDPEAPYRRPAISKGIVAGTQQPADIAIPWPEALDLSRITGTVTAVDLGRRRASATGPDAAEFELPFAGLVAATGSAARPLPLPAPDGVLSLRDLTDGRAGCAALASAQQVAIIGAGFIGLEVASSARSLGKTVTVVETAPAPLAHAVGAALGGHIARIHREHGVEIVCGIPVREVQGGATAEGLVLEDGRQIDADLVIAAVGSLPLVGWLRTSGAQLGDGLVCDRTCAAAGADGVVAAGDIASWYNPLYQRQMRVEHWTNAIEQGTYAARRLLGQADPGGFLSAPYFWSEQYHLRIQSIGTAAGHDEARILEHDGETLVVAYGRAGVLIGVAGINAGPVIPRYRHRIEAREPIDAVTALQALGS